MAEFLTLDKHDRQIISEGLKRFICLRAKFFINTQDDMTELCQNYGLM